MTAPARRLGAALLAALVPAVATAAAPANEAPRGAVVARGVGYADAIRLSHQPDPGADGPLLLVFEEEGMGGVPLYESRDDGRTWRLVTHAVDQVHAGDPDWQLRWQPNLIELGRSAGALPAGTLLLSANSTRNDAHGHVVEERLQVYASADRGRSWRHLSDIVDGGGRPEDVDNRGVWEPNLRVTPDGRLVAYYSSEQHKAEGFNQLLAHKVSADGGRTWGPEVVDVARPGEVDRPGMADVEPGPHGRSVMSYEDIDGPDNGEVHLRWSADGLRWGDPADPGTPVRTAAGGWPSASPIVRWIDDGSAEGVLVVLAEHSGGAGDREGDSLYWNADGGRGPWWQAPMPVRKLTGNIHAGWTQAFLPTRDGRFLQVTSSASPAAPGEAADNFILAASAPVAFDRYEAEDAARRGAVQIYTDAASNGSKLRVAVGGAATFPVVLRRPGAGRLVLRMADVDHAAAPRVTVDGRPLPVAAAPAAADGQGWRLQAYDTPPLAPGRHEVVVAAADHAFDLDWIQAPMAAPRAGALTGVGESVAKHRIGIVGYGKIARDQHEPAIRASDAFELVAVSNPAEGPPPAGVPVFGGYEEMLRAVPDMTAVAVCTPPRPRRAVAAAVLAAGRHALLEKPPAATLAEVDALAEAARRADRVVFTTHHSQHNAAVARAAEALAGRVVRTLRVDWREDVRRWHPGQEWVFGPGGFGVFDPGLNALSILTRILPEPPFVRAAVLSFPEGRDAPIAAELTLGAGGRDDGDLRCVFDWRETGPQVWEIAVETCDGLRLRLWEGGARLQVEGEPPFAGPRDEYPDIYRTFADRLRLNRSQVDVAPLQLVADSFLTARRLTVEPFSF